MFQVGFGLDEDPLLGETGGEIDDGTNTDHGFAGREGRMSFEPSGGEDFDISLLIGEGVGEREAVHASVMDEACWVGDQVG